MLSHLLSQHSISAVLSHPLKLIHCPQPLFVEIKVGVNAWSAAKYVAVDFSYHRWLFTARAQLEHSCYTIARFLTGTHNARARTLVCTHRMCTQDIDALVHTGVQEHACMPLPLNPNYSFYCIRPF